MVSPACRPMPTRSGAVGSRPFRTSALGLYLRAVVSGDLAANERPVVAQEASRGRVTFRLHKARVVAQAGEQESPRDRGLCLLSLRSRWLGARHDAILGGD